MDDHVDEAVLEHELGGLEAVGQLDFDRLGNGRTPAKPMTAPGSAMITSPSMAKLAVTPPVVGSVRTAMNRPLASANRARAAEVLAI